MSDGVFKLVWIVPVILWAIAEVVVGIFKDTAIWIKERY